MNFNTYTGLYNYLYSQTSDPHEAALHALSI